MTTGQILAVIVVSAVTSLVINAARSWLRRRKRKVRLVCDVCDDPAVVWISMGVETGDRPVTDRWNMAACSAHAPDIGATAREYWNGG